MYPVIPHFGKETAYFSQHQYLIDDDVRVEPTVRTLQTCRARRVDQRQEAMEGLLRLAGLPNTPGVLVMAFDGDTYHGITLQSNGFADWQQGTAKVDWNGAMEGLRLSMRA